MRAASESSSSSSAICCDAASIISTYRSPGGASSIVRSSVFAKPTTVASGVRRSWQASVVSRAKKVSFCTAVRHSTGVSKPTRHLLDDLQAASPEVALGLSRAGVTGVQKAVRIGRGKREKLIAATIDCTVDLDPSQKGVHMSRFPELFEEAVEGVVDDDAFLVEDLAEHVATRIVERQQALIAEVHIRARYPYERRTPVTGLSTQEMVSLIGIAAASQRGVRRVVGVEAVG